jgi:hypothetical protein
LSETAATFSRRSEFEQEEIKTSKNISGFFIGLFYLGTVHNHTGKKKPLNLGGALYSKSNF